VAVTFMQGDSPEMFEGTARDISLGGMCIATDFPAPFGTDVVVRMILPGAVGSALLPGVVRWNTQYGVGIQFERLSELATRAIIRVQKQMQRRRG
jgi:c-di-GMP-binding flagellar brake protein YcgR